MTDATLSSEFLARMDDAIADEFEKNGRLRRILPAEIDMPHARYGVVVPRVADRKVSTSVLRPPIALEREVLIPARQLEDLDLVLMLVRDATKRISVVEDQVIAYGGLLVPYKEDDHYLGVRIDGLLPGTEGLFGPGEDTSGIEAPREHAILAVVEIATSALDTSEPTGFHPPYAAALARPAWKDFVSARHGSKLGVEAALQSQSMAPVNGREVGSPDAAPIDPECLQVGKAAIEGAGDLKTIVTGGEHEHPRASAKRPYVSVFSSDPVDLDLVRVRRPWGSCRGHDCAGHLRYRIESQFLLRVKRAAAIHAVWLAEEDTFVHVTIEEGK